MRKTLHRFLSKSKNKDIYLLHADMWGFDTLGNVINCGIQEPNMINIASGLASRGKRVIVYGVAGFVLYKSYEQIKFNIKGWSEHTGTVIFCNSGNNGCYSIAGRGHKVDDDILLCEALSVPLYEPETRRDFLRLIKDKLKINGVSFIRLGWDNERWK